MSDGEILGGLAGWLAPASATPLTPESVARRRVAVEATVTANLSELVLAAHGDVSDGLLATINDNLLAADDSYIVGKKTELASRVAAAALMQILSEEGERPLQAALLVGSARFLGMEAKIEELSVLAAEVEQSARGRARERLAIGSPNSTFRKQLESADTLSDEELRKAFQALSRRFESIVSGLEARLQLMDEETNAIWWAQDPRSETTGQTWEEMKAVPRVATAAYEAGTLNRRRPATQGLIRIARLVGGSVGDDSVTLAKLADAFAVLIDRTDVRQTLLPIHSCAGLASEYAQERSAVSAVARTTLRLTTSKHVALRDVAEQYLRELALLSEA